LIQQIITEPVTEDINPCVPMPAAKAAEPTPIEMVQTDKPQSPAADAPAHDTAIAPVKPVEYFNEDETLRTQPSANAIPTPTTTTQGAHAAAWDLTLTEMAHALNIADNQKHGVDELQMPTMDLGPLPAQWEAKEELIVGPPAASADETVRVLAIHETRTSPDTTVETATTTAAPVRPQGAQMLDDMEISLEILRNEIQCQKENDWGANENQHQPPFEPMIPETVNPSAPKTVDPNQRTELWGSEFGSLENLLAIVRNESICAQNSTVAQNRPTTREHESASDLPAATPYYGAAHVAPPASTPRRVR
jgi:hypothetical protein